ncbi:MAG: cation:proton antiporter, partial [Bacteroidales bacterium]
TDTRMQELLRYDLNVSNAVISIILENEITDLVLGMSKERGLTTSFLGHVTDGIVNHSDVTTLIYKPVQPLSTIKRHIIIIPDKAEKEVGFRLWLKRVWNVTQNTGAKAVFYGSNATLERLKAVLPPQASNCDYKEFSNWNDFLIIFKDLRQNDTLWVIMSRNDGIIYDNINRIPNYLNTYCRENSFILVYPLKSGASDNRYLT